MNNVEMNWALIEELMTNSEDEYSIQKMNKSVK